MTMKQQGLDRLQLREGTEQSGPKIIVQSRNPQGSTVTKKKKKTIPKPEAASSLAK